MSSTIQSVGGGSVGGPLPSSPADEAARTLIAQNTRFGAVDVKAVAQAVADAPGDKAALSVSVTRALDPRDQATLVSELTVIAKRLPAPPAPDDRPHGLLDHLKDAGGVVWGAAKDIGHLAAGVARTASDLTLGPAVDAAREVAGLAAGHTPEAPPWAPSAERGVQTLKSAGQTAWTAATHPGAVVDALKAPYQKDLAEGRWGALAAQTVLDFGGLLDGESEAVAAARVAGAAEKTGEVATDLSRGAKAVERLEGALPAARSEASKGAEAAEGSQALTRVAAKVGRNEATWTLDGDRTVGAHAVIREAFDGAARGSKEDTLTREVGRSGGRVDDDGGHMIAHRFMRDQGVRNMFPQNTNLNRGAYKAMENEWADWTKVGGEVTADVKLEDFKGVRPAEIEVRFTVTDPATGKVVHKSGGLFDNEAGQTFQRVPAAKMRAMLEGGS